MAIWICRLLPWALFVPSILLWVPMLDGSWCFALGIVNGGFASACGLAARELKKSSASAA